MNNLLQNIQVFGNIAGYEKRIYKEQDSVLPNDGKYNYILGNPPFIGKHYQSKQQREDLAFVFNDLKGSTDLDYVTCTTKTQLVCFNQSRKLKRKKRQ